MKKKKAAAAVLAFGAKGRRSGLEAAARLRGFEPVSFDTGFPECKRAAEAFGAGGLPFAVVLKGGRPVHKARDPEGLDVGLQALLEGVFEGSRGRPLI